MGEIVVGVFVIFIIGIFSKQQEYITPIFSDEASEKRSANKEAEIFDPGCQDSDAFDKLEDGDGNFPSKS